MADETNTRPTVDVPTGVVERAAWAMAKVIAERHGNGHFAQDWMSEERRQEARAALSVLTVDVPARVVELLEACDAKFKWLCHDDEPEWVALKEALSQPQGETGEPVARIYQRRDEWVLEIQGRVNDTAFTSRHTEPLTTDPEDVAGLPSLYAEIAALRERVRELEEAARHADTEIGGK